MNKDGDKRARLEALINHYSDGNKSAFARLLGTRPQTVNTWLSRDMYDTELIYSKCDSVSGDWLISGEGNMLRNTSPKVEYQHDSRDTSGGGVVAEPVFHPKSREKVIESQEIPLYSFRVTGGILENIDNSTQYIEDTLRIPDAPKCDGAVRVVGDSMSPTINAGDIIAFALIRDKNYILYGHIYFVDYASEFETYMVCKIVRKSDRGDEYVALHSLNPNYDPIDVRRADIKHLALVKLSIHYHMIS